MGNPLLVGADSRVHIFASSTSWIEDAAIRQLTHLASRNGVTAVAAMPDLHPGHHGPVGCAALADGIVHADVIGTDIGCGMQLWSLDIAERHLNLDKLVQRFATLEGPWTGDAMAELEAAGIDARQYAAALGTIGGGNHFCEVQAIEDIIDPELAASAGLARGGTTLLVHSGSRGLGAATLLRHYSTGTEGLALDAGGLDYIADHDVALHYAKLNRQVIAQRALGALRAGGQEIVDSPHNLVERFGDLILHRKGAAPSNRGLVAMAGSRGAFTYLVMPLQGPAEALTSIAHGAGRKHDRGSMERRVRNAPGSVQKLVRTALGSRVICTDRRLLMEEAPEAYKDIEKVVADLEALQLIRVVTILRPVLTFKTARDMREDKRQVRS
jgi:release factor H-coupled RctB family protein